MWYNIEDNNQTGNYVSGLDGSGQPTFTTDIEQAAWAPKTQPVDRYITQNNLQNVSIKTQGGNHPGSKPPIA